MSRRDAAQRWYWLWDVLFTIDYVATVVLVLSGDSHSGRLASVGLLTCVAIGYATLGRRLVLADEPGRPGALFASAMLTLFAVATLLAPSMGFALFAICPIVYMMFPVPVASVVTALAILMPPLAVIVQHGLNAPDLTTLLPMTAFMIVFGVCIGLWLERIVKQSTERAELIKQLEASRAEVSRLSHEAGTAAERERLAKEIHDTLAQGFTSIVTLLQAVESELDAAEILFPAEAKSNTATAAARRHVNLAARTARENLAEARAMVAALTPSALVAGSLEDAVRRQGERLGEESAIAVTVDVCGPLPPLGTATEVVLLRSAQEALSNVRKHAHASTADIRLAAADGSVRLTITDDGVGFDPSAQAEGFGLRGMRARVEQIGGRLNVHSGPGGTTVEVSA